MTLILASKSIKAENNLATFHVIGWELGARIVISTMKQRTSRPEELGKIVLLGMVMRAWGRREGESGRVDNVGS